MVVRRYDGGVRGIIWGTWDNFWQETNISGANNAGKARTSPYIRRICWIILFTVFCYFTVSGVIDLFVSYHNYPVKYKVYVKHKNQIEFPAVTVCNQNRVNCLTLDEVITNCSTNVDITPCNDTEALNFMKGLNDHCPKPTVETKTKRKKRNSDTDINQHLRQRRQEPQGSDGGSVNSGQQETLSMQGDQPQSQQTENEFLRMFMSLSLEDRILIGHNLSSFIKGCTFKGRDCNDADYFQITNTPNYGTCFTFNSINNNRDTFAGNRISSMTGPFFGLSLVLNIDQDAYMDISKQAGARVTVHPYNQMPLVDEFGFDVNANTLTQAAIEQALVERQPEPYTSRCSHDWSKSNYSDYVGPAHVNYSLQQCQRFCSHSSIVMDCQCFHPVFLDDSETGPKTSPCNLTSGSDDFKCVEDIMTQLDDSSRMCQCNVDCTELEFNVFLSESIWPSNKYKATAATSYGYSGNLDKIAENLLQVNVYYKSLNVRTVSESPIYESMTQSTFITALGGALSLFLGISLSMVFEVIEFLIDLCLNFFAYFSKSKPAKSGKPKNEPLKSKK